MVLRETVASIFLASGFFREPIPHGLLRHTLNFFEVFSNSIIIHRRVIPRWNLSLRGHTRRKLVKNLIPCRNFRGDWYPANFGLNLLGFLCFEWVSAAVRLHEHVHIHRHAQRLEDMGTRARTKTPHKFVHMGLIPLENVYSRNLRGIIARKKLFRGYGTPQKFV